MQCAIKYAINTLLLPFSGGRLEMECGFAPSVQGQCKKKQKAGRPLPECL